MKAIAAATFLSLLACSAYAQSKPAQACQFTGFAVSAGHAPILAEVTAKKPVQAWFDCGYGKGCISMHVNAGSPVLIYRTKGPWTCGYKEDAQGAAPLWFRSVDLHSVSYSLQPPMTAWLGAWDGGEDRVDIRRSKDGKGLYLRGSAVWHGRGDVEHVGDLQGEVIPHENHAHLAEDGCEVDLFLVGNFILANDNNQCGGMNVRFGGLWKRIEPER